MDEPFLVEESTIFKLAPILENLVKSLDNNAKQNDYLIAVVIVVLAETGFFIYSENDGEMPSVRNLRIPQNWKSDEIYRISFEYNLQREIKCKLVAVPVGDKIILNFCYENCRCIVFQTLKYINPHSSHLSGKFWNLKEFSVRLKNEILTPMRVELLTKFGLPNPSLCGLPEELKIVILRLLDPKSRKNLSRSSLQFSRINSQR